MSDIEEINGSQASESEYVELFKTMPLKMPINEKIRITVARHEKHYFIDEKLIDIHEANEYIRPRYEVTEQNLKAFLKRDRRAKIKKVAWAYRNDVHFKNQVII